MGGPATISPLLVRLFAKLAGVGRLAYSELEMQKQLAFISSVMQFFESCPMIPDCELLWRPLPSMGGNIGSSIFRQRPAAASNGCRISCGSCWRMSFALQATTLHGPRPRF